MGKISNVLYMIDLLNTGNIYTLKDLSEKIGVSERMISLKIFSPRINLSLLSTSTTELGLYFLIKTININLYFFKHKVIIQ